jgi:hypothetical protein
MAHREERVSNIVVVYRMWKPSGGGPYQEFSYAYQAHDAGIDHELLLADQDGTDISAYLEVASESPHEFLCFLNTYTTIAADKWLLKLYDAASRPGVGLVGAMGSYETMDLPGWPDFPNPHIRSNGFMIRRDLLLSFGFKPPQTKDECYAFESGPESLTRRVREIGLSTLVVGKNGIAYDIPMWPVSETFRLGSQGNLLIHDNKAREFAEASGEDKHRHRMAAWREA